MRITTTAVAAASFLMLSSWGTVLAWTTSSPPQPRSLPSSSSSTALAASASSRRAFIVHAALLIVPPVTACVAAASPALAADGEDNQTTSWPDPVVATALAQDDRTTAEPVVAAALAAPEEAEPAPATAPVVPEPEATPAAAPATPAAPAPTTTAAEAENPFIARLKQQSDAKAGQYKKDAQRSDKLSKQMFRDQYNRPTYYGIRTKNSTGGAADAIMVLGPELQELLKSGKVTQSYESKMNKKSGEISDDYSKPIYVFTDE